MRNVDRPRMLKRKTDSLCPGRKWPQGCYSPARGIVSQISSSEKEQQMTLFRFVPTVFCAALMGAAFSPSAAADQWNKKTVITFDQPVETPGVHIQGWAVLPAGTYVFRLLESPSDRHIVQIFNQDETVIYATVLAIPNYRLRATGKTVITFRERPAGEPQSLRAWFYPGDNFGQEFVYPKEKALALARETNTPVLAAEIAPEVTAPIVSAPAEPVVVALIQAPVVAVKPTGEVVQIAEVVTLPPAEVQVAEVAVPEATLPKTASQFPLIGLAGLLALGLALALRFVRA